MKDVGVILILLSTVIPLKRTFVDTYPTLPGFLSQMTTPLSLCLIAVGTVIYLMGKHKESKRTEPPVDAHDHIGEDKSSARFAHVLLFACRDCHLPVTKVVIAPERNMETVAANQMNIRCEFCGLTNYVIGASARRHTVEEWV